MPDGVGARREVVIVGALAVLAITSMPHLALLAGLSWIPASVLVAMLLVSPRSSLVGRLPIAAILWVCVLLAWYGGLALSRPLVDPIPAVSLWAPALGIATAAWLRGPKYLVLLRRQEVSSAAVSGALLAAGAAIVSLQPFEVWSRNFFLGTDFSRHVSIIHALVTRGEVGYSGYPLGLHQLARWCLAGSDGPLTPRELWMATASVVWVCAVLTLLAVALAATRVWSMLGHRRGSWALGLVAALTYVQSFWFDRMLGEGYVVNYLVGLALAAAVAGMAEADWWDSPSGLIGAAACVVVSAHSWQLFLGVTGIVALATALHSVRTQRRWGMVVVVGVGAGVLTWPAISPWILPSPVSAPTAEGAPSGIRGWLAVQTPTGLGPPGSWWWVGISLAVLTLLVAWRQGDRTWALANAAVILVAAGTFFGLYLAVGGSWYFLSYYPAKFLATSLLLIIPTGAVGLGCVVAWAWAIASRVSSSFIARVAVAGLVGLGIVGAAGWSVAKPPNLLVIATTGLGQPPFNLIMLDALEGRALPRDKGAIVFGLVPEASTGDVLTGAAVLDSVAMESLPMAGFDSTLGSQVKGHVMKRDLKQVCLWLRDNPESVVITGPNPASGLPWLADADCPERWVAPQRWVALALPERWFSGLQLASRGRYQYPTPAEFRAWLEGGVAGA